MVGLNKIAEWFNIYLVVVGSYIYNSTNTTIQELDKVESVLSSPLPRKSVYPGGFTGEPVYRPGTPSHTQEALTDPGTQPIQKNPPPPTRPPN